MPACGPCNASKSNGEVTRWLRRRRFDERQFLLRHVAICQELAVAIEVELDEALRIG